MKDKIASYKEVILDQEVLSLKREIELLKIMLQNIQEQERRQYLSDLLSKLERASKQNEQLRIRNSNLKKELKRRDVKIKRLTQSV